MWRRALVYIWYYSKSLAKKKKPKKWFYLWKLHLSGISLIQNFTYNPGFNLCGIHLLTFHTRLDFFVKKQQQKNIHKSRTKIRVSRSNGFESGFDVYKNNTL